MAVTLDRLRLRERVTAVTVRTPGRATAIGGRGLGRARELAGYPSERPGGCAKEHSGAPVLALGGSGGWSVTVGGCRSARRFVERRVECIDAGRA